MHKDLLEIFEKSGALLEGHFVLTSGLHSPYYWEKFKIIQSPVFTETLCKLIADHFRKDNIQVVAGPTTGGIILAYETARQLGVRSVFAEKDGDKRIFRRDFHIHPEERVLVVDDILTTGGSIIEVLNAVDKLKGNVLGIGVLVDRSTSKLEFGVPLFSCLASPAIVYKPEECPLCTKGLPLIKRSG